MNKVTVVVDEATWISPTEIAALARHSGEIVLTDTVWRRLAASRKVVERALQAGEVIYGLTTGIGAHKAGTLSFTANQDFNCQLWQEQATSVETTKASREDVRAMVSTRIVMFAHGFSGVHPELIKALLALFNAKITPCIHRFGSVGCADLTQLAELGLVLMGESQVCYQGQQMSSSKALAKAGLSPYKPHPKDGLGLIDSNAYGVGLGTLVVSEANAFIRFAEVVAATSLVGFQGNLSIIEPIIEQAHPQAGQNKSAAHLRAVLNWNHFRRTYSPRDIQDPLSFRCIPQICGAARAVEEFTNTVLTTELNGSNTNPLVDYASGKILSNGNFDTTLLSLSFDGLRQGLASLLDASAQRLNKLHWSEFTDLPIGLAEHSGEHQGLEMLNLDHLGGAMIGEIRFLAEPVNLHFRGQLNQGVEDRASLLPLSVRRTHELLHFGWSLLAIEAFAAAWAIRRRQCTVPIILERLLRWMENIIPVGPSNLRPLNLTLLAKEMRRATIEPKPLFRELIGQDPNLL